MVIREGRAPKKKVVEATAAPQVWSLETSIWGPRKKWCDSKDFVDTEEVEMLRFTKDWQGALEVQTVDKLIMKSDDDGGEEEVEETRAVLWEFHDLFYAVFAYYAGTFGNDIMTLSFNGWSQFVVDCDLASSSSKHAKKTDFDRIFIGVDAKQRLGARDDQIPKKSLTRSGFFTALVHVAIAKYVQPKRIPDVSEALAALFAEDIEPRLDKGIFSESNTFRLKYCYHEDVDEMLRRNESNLRLIFNAISDKGEGKEVGKEHLLGLMDFDEWKAFMRGLNFIGPDLTERDAKLCFVNARMAVIDGQTLKGSAKETNLPFEGFLEAIVRLSVLKALPTDEEVYSAGCGDTGEFFEKLRADDMNAYKTFLATRGQPWPGAPGGQQIFRCVDHLLTLMAHEIEGKTVGSDDGLLSKGEVKEFMERVRGAA